MSGSPPLPFKKYGPLPASAADWLIIFARMADRRFYDRPTQDLVECARRVLAFEKANPRQYVRTFEEYQRATGDDNEARFVRWQVIRDDTEERIHRRTTGL